MTLDFATGGSTQAIKSYFVAPGTIPIEGDMNSECTVGFVDSAIMACHRLEEK